MRVFDMTNFDGNSMIPNSSVSVSVWEWSADNVPGRLDMLLAGSSRLDIYHLASCRQDLTVNAAHAIRIAHSFWKNGQRRVSGGRTQYFWSFVLISSRCQAHIPKHHFYLAPLHYRSQPFLFLFFLGKGEGGGCCQGVLVKTCLTRSMLTIRLPVSRMR